MNGTRQRTFLPHMLGIFYGLAIVYASLQPFAPWIPPAAGTPFWTFAPWPPRWTRFDVTANALAYLPFGAFVALIPHRASPLVRIGVALAAGATLSFALETLQMFLPTRDASVVDLLANACGSLAGGLIGGTLVRAERTRRLMSAARERVFLGGRLGDVGIALLALWLTAQTNPGIALFALIGAALLLKGLAAWLILKPAAWEAWLKPGVAFGIAAGSLGLLLAAALPRPAQVAACAVALLSSLLLPFAASDQSSLPAPLTLFNWRYGHLLNFNGLTHTVLLVWPIAAACWLFTLAGRPAWGRPD